MNRPELIEAVAKRARITEEDAKKAVLAVFDCIEDALVSGEKVSLNNFGTFEVRARAARSGRNPRTNAVIEIAEHRSVVFGSSKHLKSIVNSK